MKKTIASLFVSLMITFFVVVPAHANTNGQLSPQIKEEITKNVKSLNQLLDYLHGKGIFKTMDDLRAVMEQNKPLFKKYKPQMVDYGFTTRMYAEIFREIDDYGIEFVGSEHGKKELQRWGIPITISNTSNEPIQVSKETFLLVPRYIPQGQELYTIGIAAEAIADPQTLNYLDEVTVEAQKERNLRIYFYAPIITQVDFVNLRVYDGKDHVDINITKK